MPRLQISLLGPLQVTIDEVPAAFRTDAERALLAYLALNQGVAQRRDTLAGLLSPDRNDQDALTYLRNRLTRLRDALGDDTTPQPWLDIDRKQITLRSGADLVIDVTRFDQLLATVETHAHRQLAGCPTCLAGLQAAVDLVRGELLAGLNLPSDTWEAWLLTQREHYQQRALAALTLLRTARQERGEWAALLAVAQRQLALEPWLEEAHRALMQAHYQLGDRNAALAQYEQCAALLWEELAVEPEAETQQLRQRIAASALAVTGGAAVPDNLPLQLGGFFGRQAEQTHLLRLLVERKVRLVTLVGTGGSGKTRLALEVGQQVKASFPDGVWFVALAAIQGGAEAIKMAVGEAGGFSPGGQGQTGQQLSGDQVLAILRDKRLLLILDNCEGVLAELVFLPGWLKRAPGVTLLATAREPLNFAAETVVLLAGLPTAASESSAATALFAERGQMARADFALSAENLPQVRQICQQVDGLPLGIALAAAWVRRRSLAQISAAIAQSLDFLSSGLRDVEPRHRSMRAVFETSWQLLDGETQTVLAALAVFPTSFSAHAAAQVAGATDWVLDLLCEKSLLQQQHEAQRYLLHSLLRQFAAEKLATHTPAVERAFVDYFYEFARDHQADYAALQPEWANFLVGISRAHDQAAWQTVLDFVEAMYEPWDQQLRFSDLQQGLTLALAAATQVADQPAAAQTRLRLGQLALAQSQYAVAEAHFLAALPHFMYEEDGLKIAQISYLRGRIKREQAQAEAALALFAESKRIFAEEGDVPGIARNLNAMAYCHIMQDPASSTARAYLEQAVALQQDLPRAQDYVEALVYLARITSKLGDYVTAEAYLGQAAAASQNQVDIGNLILVLFERIVVSRRRNQLDAALRFGYECLELAQKIGSLRWVGLVKTQLGMVYQAKQQPEQALATFAEGLRIFVEIGDLFEQAFSHSCLYELCAAMGKAEQSLWHKQEALRLNTALNNTWLEEQFTGR